MTIEAVTLAVTAPESDRPQGIDHRTIEQLLAGNFRGWMQLRKTIPHEADILAARGLA